jgi:carbon monoxide dehydrogenase subunit G
VWSVAVSFDSGVIMPRFKGQLTRTFTTRANPEQTLAFLSDPSTWIAHQDEIETTRDLGNHTLEVTLKEHTHGPAKFQGKYRCTWSRGPNEARWDSADDGNFIVHGKATVRAVAGGSEVVWNESVDADVPVPRLMVRVVRPIAEAFMARGLEKFAEKLKHELDRLA